MPDEVVDHLGNVLHKGLLLQIGGWVVEHLRTNLVEPVRGDDHDLI
jgi:hypothetical protein